MRGFRLSLLVFSLSVIAAVSIPELQRRQLEIRAGEVATDLRVAADAFQTYARERGDWPPADALPGQIPTGMKDLLPEAIWTQPTPIGGAYAWKVSTLHGGQRYAAAILISSSGTNRVRSSRDEFLAIDRLVDDGDLAMGNFRLGFRSEPVWVLEH